MWFKKNENILYNIDEKKIVYSDKPIELRPRYPVDFKGRHWVIYGKLYFINDDLPLFYERKNYIECNGYSFYKINQGSNGP